MVSEIKFLGIGAQKSASTWLWKNLYDHPQVWMPHVKELHYFDRGLNYPSPSYLVESSILRRLIGTEQHNLVWKKQAVKSIASSVVSLDKDRLAWDMKYYFGRCSDAWYQSLFQPGEGQIVGEITPAYSILDPHDINRVKKVAPEAQILLLLRDPVDRAWSQLRFDYSMGFLKSLTDKEVVLDYINSDVVKRRGDYLKIVNSWLDVYPENQFMVGFYEEVQQNPEGLLGRVADQLSIERMDFNVQTIKTKAKVSKSQQMPKFIEQEFSVLYLEQLEALSKRFGGYTERWLKRAAQLV